MTGVPSRGVIHDGTDAKKDDHTFRSVGTTRAYDVVGGVGVRKVGAWGGLSDMGGEGAACLVRCDIFVREFEGEVVVALGICREDGVVE